jgi:hypothetical protein
MFTYERGSLAKSSAMTRLHATIRKLANLRTALALTNSNSKPHWSSAARSTIQISKGSDLDGGVNFYVYIQTIIQDYALTKLT